MSNGKKWFTPFLKQCYVTCSVSLNIMGQGVVLGFPAVLLPQLYHPDSPIPLTAKEGSWIASVVNIMSIVGSLVMMPLMQCSRKTVQYVATSVAVAGWVTTLFATNFLILFISRTFCGISMGMLTFLRAMVVGEYTSSKNRGACLAVVSLAHAAGILLVHLIGSIFHWKITAAFGLLFSLTSLVMTVFSLESPSWLAFKGRYDECRKVFRLLRGDDEDEELEAMIQARKALRDVNNYQRKYKGHLKHMITTIKKKEFYKPIIVMMHLVSLMIFSGIAQMAAYSTQVLDILMGPEANVSFWMVFLDAQQIVTQVAAIFFINKIKRRTIIFSIDTLSVLAHVALAAYVWTTQGTASKTTWLPALLLNVQTFSAAAGILPVLEVIAGEIFPIEYKGIAGMLCTIVLSCIMFGVIKSFPDLIAVVGLGGTYIIYAGIVGYVLVVIWFMLPETKDKTLQEIEEEFRGRPLVQEEEDVTKPLDGEAALQFEGNIQR